MTRPGMFRRALRWKVWRYWGLVVIAIMVIGLDRRWGVLPYFLMTLLVIIWALFGAPTSCGAVNLTPGNKIEYCRNDASGLMLGCRLPQHKFQRFTRAWWNRSWRYRTRDIWTGAPAKLATFWAVVGMMTGIAGLIIGLYDLQQP